MISRLALAAVVLATLALGSHLEVAFVVDMPTPASTCGGSGCTFPTSYVAGEMYYVIAQTQNAINAVNLTSRKVQWSIKDLSTTTSIVYPLAATDKIVLAGFASHIRAYSGATGASLWSLTGYTIPTPTVTYTVGNTLYVVLVGQMTGLNTLVGIDIASGMVLTTEVIQGATLDGTTLFVNKLNAMTFLPSSFEARDITTNTTIWRTGPILLSQPTAQQAVLAVNADYVFVANLTDGSDVAGIVLSRSTGSPLVSLEAFNGVHEAAVAPKFVDGKLFALIGLSSPRYVLVDLTTGFTTWTRSFAEIGAAVLSGDSLVSQSASLVLTFASISGATAPINVPQVPGQATPSIISYGGGIVQVGNLQGYTLWNANTGAYLGRNEISPSSGGAAPLRWGQYFLATSGAQVIATKLSA